MIRLKCAVSGCPSFFEVDASLGTSYRCSNHSRVDDLKAVGREFDEETDMADFDARFQNSQFDPGLPRTGLLMDEEDSE